MTIEIKKRAIPFSVTPGARFLLPATPFAVKAFPSKLEITDIETKKVYEVLFSLTGPISEYLFTADLERGFLMLRGRAQEGFYEMKISCAGAITLTLERWTGSVPFSGTIEGKPFSLQQKEGIKVGLKGVFKKTAPSPLFFLGVNKKQEVEKMYKRGDLKEILPFLYKLACFYEGDSPSFPLLEAIETLKKEKRHALLEKAFLTLIEAHFPSFFIPTLQDEGRGFTSFSEEISPQLLFPPLKQAIFSLFFEEKGETLILLPHLLPQFFSGRWQRVCCLEGKVEISLEWTKKNLRRMEITGKKGGEIALCIPSSLKSARLSTRKKKCKESI